MPWYLWGITGIVIGVILSVGSIIGFTVIVLRSETLTQRFVKRTMGSMSKRRHKNDTSQRV